MISRLLDWWRVDHKADAAVATVEAARWRAEYMKMRGRVGALSRARAKQDQFIKRLLDRAHERQTALDAAKQALVDVRARYDNKIYSAKAAGEAVVSLRRQVRELEKALADAQITSQVHQMAIIDKIMAMDADQTLPPTSEWLEH